MSNNRYDPNETGDPTKDAENWGSLEGIHNTLHDLTGGPGHTEDSDDGGHMSAAPRSAFDPIFWLHNTYVVHLLSFATLYTMLEIILTDCRNIDRLFAMWQALHEDDHKKSTYVTKQISNTGSFTIVANKEYEDIKTPLYPFRDTATTWYTSEKTKRTEKFGYTYPETIGLQYPVLGSARNNLVNVIKKYYPSLSDMIIESKNDVKEAGAGLLPRAEVLKQIVDKKLTANTSELLNLVSDLPTSQTLLQTSLKPNKPFIRDLAPHNKYLEWLINTKAEKHSLDGAYIVHTFLGSVEEE